MLYIYKTIKNPSLANVFLQFCMSLLMWPQLQIFLLCVLIVLFFFRGVDSNFLCPCVIHLFATQHHPNLFYAFCLMCQLFSEFLPSIVLRPFLTTELEKKKGEREEYVNTKENLSLIYYLIWIRETICMLTLDWWSCLIRICGEWTPGIRLS